MARPALHDKATLTKILDSQCSNPSVAVACARAGISPASFWNYRLLSANGDAAFVLEYLGIEAQFASHLRLCRDIYMASVEAAALTRAERGTRELIFHHGQPSWKFDHRYEGWSDEDMRDLGLSNEDRYQHDPVTHARIQNSILHAAPVELVKSALAAYSKRWAAQSHVEVDQRSTLGVTILGDAKPKAVDVTPARPQIETKGAPTETPGIFEEVRDAVESKLFNDSVATLDHPEAANRTGGLLIESISDGVDRNPDNPMRVALLAEQEIRRRRIEAEAAAGKLPPVAPPIPPEMKPDPDRDLPDDGTMAPKTAPAPSRDTVAEQIYAIKKKVHDGVALGPIERQVIKALERGSPADARTLLGYRGGERDGIGRGDAPGGGAELTLGQPGSNQKMV